jgi:hypothetical protein
MADNVGINAATDATPIDVAADEIASVKYQRVKLIHGADGVNDGDVASGNPLPVTGPLTDTQLRATALPVSVASIPSHAVTNAGTFAVQVDSALPAGTNAIGKLAANTGVTIGAVELAASQTLAALTTLTGGGIAHDSADSGNPHKVGGVAIAGLSTATLVAAADRTNLYAGTDGALIVRPQSGLEDLVSGVAAITDGSSTSTIAAQGSGVKTYITDVTIANTSATAVTVDIRDGAAGSVKWTFPVPAGGGVTHSFSSPLGFTANTAVCSDPSASASTVTVSLAGFKSKV